MKSTMTEGRGRKNPTRPRAVEGSALTRASGPFKAAEPGRTPSWRRRDSSIARTLVPTLIAVAPPICCSASDTMISEIASRSPTSVRWHAGDMPEDRCHGSAATFRRSYCDVRQRFRSARRVLPLRRLCHDNARPPRTGPSGSTLMIFTLNSLYLASTSQAAPQPNLITRGTSSSGASSSRSPRPCGRCGQRVPLDAPAYSSRSTDGGGLCRSCT